MAEKWEMKWQVDFKNYFNVFSSFIIDGYIDDLQPIMGEDGLTYMGICDYFALSLYENRDKDKKCVIIYDPSECEAKRFRIAVPFVETQEGDGSEEEDTQPAFTRAYDDKLAQHFWEIISEESVEQQMIGHEAGGVSLDMARIHYAVTEDGRMSDNEILNKFRDFWRNLTESDDQTNGYVFVLKMSSRLLSREGNTSGMDSSELMLFRELLNITQNIDSRHKFIVLANKVTDLPMWFTDESINPFVKKLTVERPSEANKEAFFDRLVEDCSFGEAFDAKYREMTARTSEEIQNDRISEAEKKIKRKFLAYTNDFTMRMLNYYRLFLEQGNAQIDTPDKIGYSIALFKAGSIENPWEDEEKVNGILRITDVVKKKIKGQDNALETVQNIMTRAAMGLGRADNPNAPRVVLFLAGPTGTGKTEICKQLAEAIFGSEDRIVRFDMSEYGAEHADQKLFGAPPGYVGYEEGGKLTNAMKKEPFSLVLFDEIEKAHGSILDKFLQILSDGRLTDGKGETVSFTDAIIAFTSNAGVTSPTPRTAEEAADIEKKMGGDKPAEEEINMEAVIRMEENGDDENVIYEKVKEYFRYNVKYYFCCTLNRPELYGRIEDSLVYYNYIGKSAVKTIAEMKMKAINAAAKDRFKLDSVVYDDDVLDKLTAYCQTEKVRSMGARGIGKAINKIYESSMANYLTPYVTGSDANGNTYSASQLERRVLRCVMADSVQSIKDNNDFRWSIT